MPAHFEQGLLKRNPFETIDQTGVGDLVRSAQSAPLGQAGPQARRLRRARRRPRVDRCSTPPAGLRELLALRVPIARSPAQAIVGSTSTTK